MVYTFTCQFHWLSITSSGSNPFALCSRFAKLAELKQTCFLKPKLHRSMHIQKNHNASQVAVNSPVGTAEFSAEAFLVHDHYSLVPYGWSPHHAQGEERYHVRLPLCSHAVLFVADPCESQDLLAQTIRWTSAATHCGLRMTARVCCSKSGGLLHSFPFHTSRIELVAGRQLAVGGHRAR